MRIKMDRARPCKTVRAIKGGDLSSGSYCKDLTSFIIAAGGTDPMGHIRSTALRAGAQLGQGHDTVIRPAHALAALRWFAFGDTHILLNSCFLLLYSDSV